MSKIRADNELLEKDNMRSFGSQSALFFMRKNEIAELLLFINRSKMYLYSAVEKRWLGSGAVTNQESLICGEIIDWCGFINTLKR